jgi:twitching motility protein PilT
LADFADIITTVLERGASDLHLSVGSPPIIRVNGALERLELPVLRPPDTRELIYGILNQSQRQKLETNLEIDFSYAVPGRARFRVNAYYQRASMGAAFRLVPTQIKTLDELKLPKSLNDWTTKPRGLILVTGPTGSGKSTTLASLINEINEKRAVHIMTVEDPIEFLHRHKKAMINQREVGADTHGFENALRSVLRQDPDVILVGEMRDLETIQIAMTAAETGHLVFGTLHTSDAPQTVDRVIDVFPPHQQDQVRVMLANSLQGVCCQQLLPTTTGGRTVVTEVLNPTPAVRNLIREGKTHQIYSVMQTGSAHGMQTMDYSLAELVRQGRISMNVALERCHSPEEFRRILGHAGGGGAARLQGNGNARPVRAS